MKRNEIEFDPEALVGSVEAFAAHVQGKQKLTLRISQLSLPAPIEPMGLRKSLRCARSSTSARRCLQVCLTCPR